MKWWITARNSRAVNVLRLVLDDIARLLPFYFIFYLASMALARLVPSWSEAFYWPAFHISVAAMTLLAVMSDRVRGLGLWRYLRLSGSFLAGLFRRYFSTRRSRLKLLLAVAVLVLALVLDASPWNLLILAFALASVFSRVIGVKWPLGLGLASLLACAVLLQIGRTSVAGQFAVHAYYFLGIALLTLVADHFRTEYGDQAARQ